MKERHSYGSKWQLSLGNHPFPANYEVPSLKGQTKCPESAFALPFFMERDVTPLALRWNVPDSMAGKPLIG